MISDFHNLQLLLLCQVSKSAPNILWSMGSSLQNQFLQVGRENPAVIMARMSLNSVLERGAGRKSGAPRIGRKASRDTSGLL